MTYRIQLYEPGVLRVPYVCRSDADNSVLIADRDDNRLQVMRADGQWSVVELGERIDNPRAALWWNHEFFVAELYGQIKKCS